MGQHVLPPDRALFLWLRLLYLPVAPVLHDNPPGDLRGWSHRRLFGVPYLRPVDPAPGETRAGGDCPVPVRGGLERLSRAADLSQRREPVHADAGAAILPDS